MNRRITFVTDNIEIEPKAGSELRITTRIALHELLEGVSDNELLEVMDIDNIRKWLAAKEGVA